MKPALMFAIPILTLLAATTANAAAGAARGAQTVADKTKSTAGKTSDVIVKDTKVVADKTMDGLSKTGEVMTDGWIDTRIHAQFVNESLLKDSDIHVATSKHIVTLKGTVMTRSGRTRALKIARETEGVHSVVNKMTVGPKRKA